MNILKTFPEKEDLLSQAGSGPGTIEVNNHIHTPFSFSAFNSVSQAVELAVKENIKVLGVNDFFVRDAYEEFASECYKNNVFPVFNIEFIGLNKEDQKNNIRVNDPNNPGRTYFSGKGLKFPASTSWENKAKLDSVIRESQVQAAEMISKLNDHIAKKGYTISFTMEEMYENYAKNLVRERHIATALHNKASKEFSTTEEQIKFFTDIFNGETPKSDLNDVAAFENEIRSRLLKSGGAAFVEEDDKAFLDVTEIRELILDMGGIPTYPLLLDDKNGNFTDFEGDKEKLAATLKERGVYSIELIPLRNSFENLKDYVEYFYNEGFVISFGTEHNTPSLDKLKVDCMGNVDLDDSLKNINLNGVAVLAAHQYLNAKGDQGYVDGDGNPAIEKRGEFEKLGLAILNHYFNTEK